jgi:hypothetical protein
MDKNGLEINGKEVAGFTLENAGPGPAIVKSHKFFFNLDEVGNSADPGALLKQLKEIMTKEHLDDFNKFIILADYVLPPGKALNLITISYPKDSIQSQRAWSTLMKFDSEVEYESIYGERFTTDSRKVFSFLERGGAPASSSPEADLSVC